MSNSAPHCPYCGSHRIRRVALMNWDDYFERWELARATSQGECRECEGAFTLPRADLRLRAENAIADDSCSDDFYFRAQRTTGEPGGY